MKIIDAHHHIWIPEQTDPDIGYRWLRDIGAIKPFGDPTPIQRDYDWDEFASESSQHTLVGSVFLQTDGALPDPVLETEWAADVLSQSELRCGVVSFLDLDADNAEIELQRHQACGLLKGVRQIVSRLDDQPTLSFAATHYLRSPKWQANLALLSDQKLSFDLQLYPEQMHEAADVFARYPELTVIIDHTGSPWDQTPKGYERWKAGIEALAKLPHCVMKLSGFGMFDAGWSASSIEPMLNDCMASFGSERILFGSNYPVDKLMATYDDVVNRVSTGIESVCNKQNMPVAAVLDDVFYRTAERVYKL